MVFTTKKADKAREKEMRRAVLLLKRVNEDPPADLIQKVALGLMVKKIPDDIRAEAAKAMLPGESRPAVATTLEAAVQDVVAHPGSAAELARALGISEDEMQEILAALPVDFESRVAAQAARLAGQE